jgi:hypothetical protein
VPSGRRSRDGTLTRSYTVHAISFQLVPAGYSLCRLIQTGYTSYSSYRLIWTHTDRLPLRRTCTRLSALSMHSRRHRSHVRSRYYHKRLHTCGDLSITPKFSVAPQQRPLFIYFNIYHLGFIQIIACVSSDVSIISSHHSTSASFHFCAY